MENSNTNKATAAQQVSEVIMANIKRFARQCELILDSALDASCEIALIPHKNCAEAIFNLQRQYLAEDLVDILATEMDMTVLYADRSVDGVRYRVVGFTRPNQDEMSIVYINSQMHGIVEDMTVVFYESIEHIFAKVKQLFYGFMDERDSGSTNHVLEMTGASQLWGKFFNL